MKDFVITICLLEGLSTLIGLLTLGTQTTPLFSSGALAVNIGISIMVLVWGSVLLSKK